MAVRLLEEDAEGIAQNMAFLVRRDEDRRFFLLKKGGKLRIRVFFCAGAEQIGTARMMELLDLEKKPAHAFNIVFCCSANVHVGFPPEK